MKVIDLIDESLLESKFNKKTSIIVDIQPSYAKWCDKIITPNFFEFLKSQQNILWFYNGEEVGSDDNPDNIFQWLVQDYDFDEEELDNIFNKIEFKEKSYGFLREYMDSEIPDWLTIKVLRLMKQHKVWNASDLDLEEFLGDDYWEFINPDGKDYFPDIYLQGQYIKIAQLKQYGNGFICGGGKDECLREIQIIMNAFNIKYTILKEFVY